MIFPTGDGQGRMVAQNQPVTLAAFEGLFETTKGAPIVFVGQPEMDQLRLDNPIEVPKVLSLLTYKRWNAEVKGLQECPRNTCPDHITFLYYRYHMLFALRPITFGIM